MNSARLLFARPRQGASLAPIYAALLSLVALGLIAFAVALWPEGSEPSSTAGDKVAPASGNTVVGPGRSQKLRPAPGPGRWA